MIVTARENNKHDEEHDARARTVVEVLCQLPGLAVQSTIRSLDTSYRNRGRDTRCRAQCCAESLHKREEVVRIVLNIDLVTADTLHTGELRRKTDDYGQFEFRRVYRRFLTSQSRSMPSREYLST